MPQLAAFPKAYLDSLCVDGSMSLVEWIELSGQLDLDGLEFYGGFLDLTDADRWGEYRRRVEDQGRVISMLCCSPDFTHPDQAFRQRQIDLEKGWIDMAQCLGAGYCRVLSGQRRPEISREAGLEYCRQCFEACLEHAATVGITLTLENHYKDNFWHYPEFAQQMEAFCDLLGQIDPGAWPNFGVNYDPSNTILAGEDPLELLERVKHRVVTMHASDRYLTEGTIEDLRREESDSAGYAQRLCHGEIGQGVNDYDAIFSTLAHIGFDGWISIEDGVDGFDQLERSVRFLRQKIARHWPLPRS